MRPQHGDASYPAVGGALATYGWYYPFALPLLAIPIAFLVPFSLHNPEPHNEQGLKEYARTIWSSVKNRTVAGLFAGSLVTLVLLFGSLIVYLPILMEQALGGVAARHRRRRREHPRYHGAHLDPDRPPHLPLLGEDARPSLLRPICGGPGPGRVRPLRVAGSSLR